jgi:hypothetical protein
MKIRKRLQQLLGAVNARKKMQETAQTHPRLMANGNTLQYRHKKQQRITQVLPQLRPVVDKVTSTLLV